MRVLFFVFALVPISVSAQWQEVGKINLPSINKMYVDGKTIYACGDNLSVSHDKGDSWNIIYDGYISAVVKIEDKLIIGHRFEVCALTKNSSGKYVEEKCGNFSSRINDLNLCR